VEPLGTALLTDEIPASRAVTAIVSRDDIAEALRDPDHAPELYLDLERGDERSTLGISWSYGELEHLFETARGDDIAFTFDSDELAWAFDDVEAHGFREKAIVFAVAATGALASGATIANAAPIYERGSDGAASIAAVQALAADSIATTGGTTSNVHTPGLQIGDEGSAASAASIKLSTEPSPAVAVDDAAVSNAHRPGVQIGPGESSAVTPSASVSAAKVADDGVTNVHTPGLQLGPGESTGSAPAVKVSAGSSDGEFLGVDTRDATEALIAGGVLLAIAGATFAGTRRPGSARPA
jgi:hypothetical protein